MYFRGVRFTWFDCNQLISERLFNDFLTNVKSPYEESFLKYVSVIDESLL